MIYCDYCGDCFKDNDDRVYSCEERNENICSYCLPIEFCNRCGNKDCEWNQEEDIDENEIQT